MWETDRCKPTGQRWGNDEPPLKCCHEAELKNKDRCLLLHSKDLLMKQNIISGIICWVSTSYCKTLAGQWCSGQHWCLTASGCVLQFHVWSWTLSMLPRCQCESGSTPGPETHQGTSRSCRSCWTCRTFTADLRREADQRKLIKHTVRRSSLPAAHSSPGSWGGASCYNEPKLRPPGVLLGPPAWSQTSQTWFKKLFVRRFPDEWMMWRWFDSWQPDSIRAAATFTGK